MSAIDYLRYLPEQSVRKAKLLLFAALFLVVSLSFCGGVLVDRVMHS